MKPIYSIYTAVLCLSMLPVGCQQVMSTVSVTVVEEAGGSIRDADVTVTYLGAFGDDTQRVTGKTDDQGTFVAKGSTVLDISIRVTKDGYYATTLGDLNRKEDHDLKVILRKKINPIPLYAGKFRRKITEFNKPYGLDLEMGDWVAPHGKGRVTDLIFEVFPVENSEGELGGRLEVTFSKDKEGALKISEANGYLPLSELKMPNLAAMSPYGSAIQRIEFGYENVNKPINTSYFFRTREKKDEKGESKYHYSKLLSGINFKMGGGRFVEEPSRSKYPLEYGLVEFIYYFNPKLNDRNLEFDVQNNLREDLKAWDRVNNP